MVFGLSSTANPSRVFITNCLISKNVNGVRVKPNAGVESFVQLNNVRSVENSGIGVLVDGATSTMRLNGSVVAANGTGLSALNGGTIVPYGNNVIVGNAVNGAPWWTTPVPQ